MDDDEELSGLLAEFGIRGPNLPKHGEDDALLPRWDETDGLGGWDDDPSPGRNKEEDDWR